MSTQSLIVSVTERRLTTEPNLHSVLWAEFVAPVLDGAETIVRQIEFGAEVDLSVFDGIGHLQIDVRADSWGLQLRNGDGWTAAVNRNGRIGSTVTVRGSSLAPIKSALALFSERIPDPEPAEETRVAIDFWQVSDDVYRRTRQLEAPAWSDIASNYPDEVVSAVEALVATEFDPAAGKLVLWHGPPGTGKTTALRALAREWKDRCRVQVLLDPERIFASSSNLFEVIIDSDDSPDWRVIVIEDADELIRADAKERVGQALSRLLNLADGILGQGLPVLTLITTNEPIDRLHPALIRPGRCLAEIDFRAFTSAEARTRWPDRPFGGGSVSLADALGPAVTQAEASSDDGAGLYL